jgi:hypothetical protein
MCSWSRCAQLEPARIVSYKLNQIISDYFKAKHEAWSKPGRNTAVHLCTGEVYPHDSKSIACKFPASFVSYISNFLAFLISPRRNRSKCTDVWHFQGNSVYSSLHCLDLSLQLSTPRTPIGVATWRVTTTQIPAWLGNLGHSVRQFCPSKKDFDKKWERT